MTHGIQNDWLSCSVILPNTIVHSVFNDSIWIPRRAALNRVNQFLKFAKGVRELKKALERTQAQNPQLLDLQSNVKLTVSVAHVDHNFPDMLEVQQQMVVKSIVQSCLSLADLLNPSYGSESEDDIATADESLVDKTGADPKQTCASEVETGCVMLVDDHSLSGSMNINMASGVPDHLVGLLEDANQGDIQKSMECEVLTQETCTHDSIAGSKTNEKSKNLASIFLSFSGKL